MNDIIAPPPANIYDNSSRVLNRTINLKISSYLREINIYGRDIICTQDFSKKEIDCILKLASLMKKERYNPFWTTVFRDKTFLMFFLNSSLRTRLSFEIAATELGGHAIYMTHDMCRFKTATKAGETIEDASQVMSRLAAGIGVRALEEAITKYGEGNQLILEFAKWSDKPVINMADDRFHPCQGLADVLGWLEYYQNSEEDLDLACLKNKNFLLTWSKGKMARTWSSVHEAILIASRYGMNVTIARPEGYDLDNDIYKKVKENASQHNAEFNVINSSSKGYEQAHIVYSRNWMSNLSYENNQLQTEREIENAMEFSDWITTEEKMSKTDNAIFTHCMPVDRGNEVEDAVASGKKSIIYNVAENRLHVQKSIIALTMGNLFDRIR